MEEKLIIPATGGRNTSLEEGKDNQDEFRVSTFVGSLMRQREPPNSRSGPLPLLQPRTSHHPCSGNWLHQALDSRTNRTNRARVGRLYFPPSSCPPADCSDSSPSAPSSPCELRLTHSFAPRNPTPLRTTSPHRPVAAAVTRTLAAGRAPIGRSPGIGGQTRQSVSTASRFLLLSLPSHCLLLCGCRVHSVSRCS